MLAHRTPKREYRVLRRAVLLLLGVTALLGSTLALAAPAANPQSHPVALASQGPQTPENLPPPSIRFDRITIADGLSFSKVDVILQDRQGFVWIGTERRLNKVRWLPVHRLS